MGIHAPSSSAGAERRGPATLGDCISALRSARPDMVVAKCLARSGFVPTRTIITNPFMSAMAFRCPDPYGSGCAMTFGTSAALGRHTSDKHQLSLDAAHVAANARLRRGPALAPAPKRQHGSPEHASA